MVYERLVPARLPINSVMDVVSARRTGFEMAQTIGFPLPEATKIAVVISELGRNIVLYADGKGSVTLIPYGGEKKGIKIIAEDEGPGIKELDLVLRGNYSTSRGLGVGISGSKRLVDEFDIRTTVGVGTIVTAVKWL
jgi:serine/threonine-protein kinase RsbT